MAVPHNSIHTGAEIDESITKVKGQTPGAASANQALILGASKDIDTIDIVKDGLEIDGVSVTITAAEANKLDGLTASTAELNILGGVTADAAELNITDGLTATTAELNNLDRSESDGVAEASKAIVLDSNKDLLGKRYDINQSVLGLIASGPFMRFEAGLSPIMTVSDPSDLDFNDGDFTIVHCMIIDGTQEVRIGKGATSSADQGYEIRFQTDGDIEVFVSDGSSYIINTSSTPLGQYTAGEVFILALTFDKDGNLTQYYNGVVQGTLDISSSDEKSVSNSSDFYIDRTSAGGHSDFFHYFYNLALTLGEVRALSSGLPVTYANSGASMTNLITNGTMEADANWANYNTPSTNARSSAQKHSGTYSRKFTADSSNDGIQGDTFTTVTGKKQRHIIWVYPDDGTVVTISIRKGDNSGFLYNAETTGLTQDTWNRIVIETTESAGGSGAYIVVQSGGETSGSWYVDDIWSGQIGNTVRFNKNGIAFTQWQDTSGNELLGSVAAATPENLPADHKSRYVALGLTGASSYANAFPAGYYLSDILLNETASGNPTLKLGTSSGGSEIMSITVPASGFKLALQASSDVLSMFSKTADKTIYIDDTGAGWDSATIDFIFMFSRVY